MAKSYWTRIQTPNGLKYFRADDVTDELLQKIKDESSNVFWAEYDVTQFDDIKDAYDAGMSIYVVKSESRNSYIYSLKSYFHYESDPSMDQFLFTCMCQSEERLITCFTSNWNTSATRHFANYSDVSALSGSVAPSYSSIPCPIPEGTYATRNNVLYRANTTITSSGTYAEWDDSQWDLVTVGGELKELDDKAAEPKAFYATMFVTPYDDIKTAYDAGMSIVVEDNNAFYHMFDCSDDAGSENFQFSAVHGSLFLLWTCNKTGYDATNGWNPQPDVVSSASQDDVAPKYSAASTYDVGDLAFYDDALYRCTTAITVPEAWTASHWTSTTIDTELKLIDTPTNVSQGFGVATAALGTSPAFTVVLAGYTLNCGNGGIVNVRFNDDVPASATLDINDTGAKAIYHKGAPIGQDVIKDGDTALLSYDGTNYVLMGVDSSIGGTVEYVPAYEHTNEVDYRNVPQDSKHWFNYRNGDTGAPSPGNLIEDYYFGNRNNSIEGVRLNADGLNGRQFATSASSTIYCIKLTRLNTTTTDCASIRVMICGAPNEDNIGYVDIVVKMRPSGTWHAEAFVNARGSYGRLGQCTYQRTDDYQSVGGSIYIGVNISNENASRWCMPMLLGHVMSDPADPAMKVELGNYTPSYTETTLQTRHLAYVNYEGNWKAAVGSSRLPVYANESGRLVPCGSTLPQTLVKTSNFNLYGIIGNYDDYDTVNILNTSNNNITIYMSSSSTSDTIGITSKYFTSFIKYGQRWYPER